MAEVIIWKVKPQPDGYTITEIELQPEAVTLDSISRQIPGGSYTTFRTFGGNKVIRLSEHIHRLSGAARIIHRNGSLLDDSIIREVLADVIAKFSQTELRIRLTMDLEHEPGTVYIAALELAMIPPEAYENGVKTVTRHLSRSNPKAKLTNFISHANEIRQQLPGDIHEALMVDESGYVLEGLSSNFFGIKDDLVWTADEQVLSGVTRAVVLEEIQEEGLTLRLEPYPLSQIPELSEAFITSSSRGVLPVVKIDEHIIGDGKPGKLTRKLSERYQKRIEGELEKI
jgi:branched-chain amino acid aminotransferase